jgi:hypothetical protein
MAILLSDVIDEIRDALNVPVLEVYAGTDDELNALSSDYLHTQPLIFYKAIPTGTMLITPALAGYINYNMQIMFIKSPADDAEFSKAVVADEMLTLVYQFFARLRRVEAWGLVPENQQAISMPFTPIVDFLDNGYYGIGVNFVISIYPNFDRDIICN